MAARHRHEYSLSAKSNRFPHGVTMKQFVSYLMFDGNAREAMTLYQKAFGGKLSMTTFGEAPGAEPAPAADSRIMHARLELPNGPVLMASDTHPRMMNGAFIRGAGY